MGYKDEMWYRKLTQALEDHRAGLTEKQVAKFQLAFLLRVVRRVKDNSDACETCRGYQQILTRLEEEFQELAASKAQRQYQKRTLAEISEHYVKAHRMAPAGYHVRKWLRNGLAGGSILGFVAMFLASNLLYFPAGVALGAVFGYLYGSSEDSRVAHDHRVL